MIKIYDSLKKWSILGEERFPDGSVKIAHVPLKASEAYLHSLIAPLDEAGIGKIEEGLDRKLPEQLKSFYLQNNGFHCYFDFIGMYGLRASYSRTTDTYLMPFDIIQPNKTEWFLGLPKDCVVFGYYGSNGSRVCLLPDGTVGIGQKEKLKTFSIMWDSINAWLNSELERMDKLFDSSGMIMVDHENTLP